jgi:LuxR family maltose regulon positive regulatory protein
MIFPPLMHAKLYRPRPPSSFAPLPRLHSLLNQDLDRPLTLISAPLGFGKTTLLSDWLASSPRPSAWLSLDEHDNELATFLHYLVAAVNTIFPGACEETLALLQGTVLPSSSVLRSVLSNDLDDAAESGQTPAGQRFILVLDDYHLIHRQEIHQIIDGLLLQPPRFLHLVLSVRRDPPLSLALLRGHGQITELRSGSLRFRSEEIAALLRVAVPFPVDQRIIDAVEEQTEGWPAGLRFAALALNLRGDDPANLQTPADARHALDYLTNEMWAQLPADTQDFLLQTAILERLNGSLCDALLAETATRGDGQRQLEWLEQENIFTIRLDGQGEWYRYHHLFQRLLREQLARRYRAEEIAALHRRASTWFAAHGLIEEALRSALAAGDPLSAARLIESHRHDALNSSQFRRLDQWLRLLPSALIATRPHLLLVEAWLLQQRWQLADLALHLDQVQVLLAQPPLAASEQSHLQSEIDVLRSYCCYYAGHGSDALAYAARALQQAPMAHSGVRGFAWMGYIGALHMQGDLAGAQQAIFASLKEARRHDNAFPVLPLIAYSGVSWMAADLPAVRQGAARLQALIDQRNLIGEQEWADYFHGCAAYQANDLNRAQQAFQAVVGKQRQVHGFTFGQAALGLASVHLALGVSQEAEALGDTLLALALERGDAGILAQVQTLRALIALRLGRMGEVQRWAAAYDREMPLAPMPMFLPEPLLLAQILVQQATPQNGNEAARWLQGLLSYAIATRNTLREIEVRALQALLHDANGQEEAALAALREAIRLAEPGGVVRVFVDLGPRMALLVGKLAAAEPAASFAGHLAPAWPPAPVSSQPDLRAVLTRREREVLTLLAQRLTAREIAERLVISDKTVSRHTATIYQKLGVNKRQELAALVKESELAAARP